VPDNRVIDLRSDTVTRPTAGMRKAIAAAEVGDDVFGDDPTVTALEARVAALYGMGAALFVPSGTMANQVALAAHTSPGDEIICHRMSHVYQYEGGAPAALAGCSTALLEGDRGMFTAEDVLAAIRPDDPHFPRTSLVVLENTQNRGGGAVWALEDIASIAESARANGLKIHLDGARIMNACVAAGVSPADYGRHFDSATICFSKGLGAPVGSALAGDAEFIYKARRVRKRYGGGMRQAGILAAAALYALDCHVDRLADDHAHAQRLADGLAACSGISVELPETNIVYLNVDPACGTAQALQQQLEEVGVRTIAVSPQRIRAVTHLEIGAADIDTAIAAAQQLTTET